MDTLTRLKTANAEIRRRDQALDRELVELAPARERATRAPEGELTLETIVMRTGRPVLAIKHDEAQLTFDDADSVVWKERLVDARERLVSAAKAVGRIEVEGHRLEWLGTGWLVAPDVIVTNRHVAAEFGRRDGTSFVFRQGLQGDAMRASVDFLEEFDREQSLAFELQRILHIEDSDGPDVAFLHIDQVAGETRGRPIRLAETAQPDDFVAVIGYPARDSRTPDVALMDRIFGNVYDKKRLAPGQLIASASDRLTHDCTTLGGNSGSAVVSLATGEAVGLHFAGRFLEANFAVSSQVLAQRLADVRRGPTAPRPGSTTTSTQPTDPEEHEMSSVTRTFVIPLTVTVEIGDPSVSSSTTGVDPRLRPTDVRVGRPGDDADEVIAEGRPEDYVDREGYVAAFLGAELAVPLPEVTCALDDVLTFQVDGHDEHVLKYEHFSVVMSASRRLCRYSAVNIDGTQSKRFARSGWRSDPRIPADAQIKSECYGNPPKFSRGHMTRREDPVWGADAVAAQGNSDSMHVTNAVPQMQPFNGGIWLELENYALQNARRDEMRISVMTGPFLVADDPTRFGVQVPVEFWKVIAFVHDETGELCATGYTMSQQTFLSEDEFVFGAHETSQRSIRSIERKAGLSFGSLAELDPFVETEGVTPILNDVSEIQFLPRR